MLSQLERMKVNLKTSRLPQPGTEFLAINAVTCCIQGAAQAQFFINYEQYWSKVGQNQPEGTTWAQQEQQKMGRVKVEG